MGRPPINREHGVLTRRQIDILELAALGLTDAAIGRRLGLNRAAVRYEIRKILTQLTAKDRTHAVAIALVSKAIKGPAPVAVTVEGVP